MIGIKAQIIRCINDESYPIVVECCFEDAHGWIHLFHDKDVIFSSETLDENTRYPLDAIVGCEIVERSDGYQGVIVRVNTEKPWGIASTQGRKIFDVMRQQLVEFEH
ncbi:MAG TPA: hypothetical protein VGB45_10455 [Abditibacterium sp.]|jgi:hypothetical protein